VWIFTKQGFLSIKQHNDDPKKLLIRARVNGDLEKIFPGCKVTKNAGTDYKYRTTVDRSAAAAVIANAVLGINYTEGFKTSVDDHHRESAVLPMHLGNVGGHAGDAQQKAVANRPA
jgi:hypothetical protein